MSNTEKYLKLRGNTFADAYDELFHLVFDHGNKKLRNLAWELELRMKARREEEFSRCWHEVSL